MKKEKRQSWKLDEDAIFKDVLARQKELFLKQFRTDESCLEYIFKYRYGSKWECPKCGKIAKWAKNKNKKSYSCSKCSDSVFPLAGTPLEKTRVSLVGCFKMLNATQIEGSTEWAKELTVTRKTASRLLGIMTECRAQFRKKYKNNKNVESNYIFNMTLWHQFFFDFEEKPSPSIEDYKLDQELEAYREENQISFTSRIFLSGAITALYETSQKPEEKKKLKAILDRLNSASMDNIIKDGKATLRLILESPP